MSIAPIEKVLYTAKAHSTAGREGGASRTSDGDVKFLVSGTPGTGTILATLHWNYLSSDEPSPSSVPNLNP